MSGNPVEAANNIFFSPYSVKFASYVILQAIGVYVNLYLLIPRFLEKGRFIEYLVSLVITIFFTTAFIVMGYYISVLLSGKSLAELYNVAPNDYTVIFKSHALPSTIAVTTLAMSIKLTKNWIHARQRQQLLEKEKLETELKFLKSQFNPHFLFNTINSIFCLIHKNPNQASDSLAKFSDLLRYQLYECNEQQIPLSHEFIYLENFVELEKLRQESNLKLSLNIDRQGTGNLVIAPFILMPFIENAFKHVSQFTEKQNWIKVDLQLDDNQLLVDISNSISTSSQNASEILNFGGIGLKNVKRRLDLLYPNRYELIIKDETEFFHVQLQLALNKSDEFQRTHATGFPVSFRNSLHSQPIG